MAVTLKIKRRDSSGDSGAPNSLKSGELAFNEVAATKTLFYGYGDDGSGNASSIVAIAGEGAYTTLTTAQTISGDKTFTGTVNFSGATVQGIATNTDELTEGSTNLFFTNARGRAAISATTATGATYNTTSGVIALASIPNSSLANAAVSFTNGSTAFAGNLGQTVTIQGTANEVEVGSDSASKTLTVGLPNDVTIGNDLTVTGDLVVNGTTTTVNSTTVTVDDKNLELGSVATPTDSTADGGGITLKGASDYTITWVNSTDSWTFNQNINITTGGVSIGGTQVLTSARQLKNTAITGTGNTIDNIVLDGGVF